MNGRGKSWTSVIRSRFRDRELLSRDQCYEIHFAPLGLPEELALECLDFIEIEFGVPVGLLRPTDRLSLLFTEVSTKNPLKWLAYRVREGDSRSELDYELGKRLRRYGILDLWKDIDIETIGDLLCAWCGERPTT